MGTNTKAPVRPYTSYVGPSKGRVYGDGYYGLYKGIVEDVDDPLSYGRARVRVASVYDPDFSKMPPKDLPWADPCLPAGSLVVPEVGAVVWVAFQGGMGDYPVYLGEIYTIPEGYKPRARVPAFDSPSSKEVGNASKTDSGGSTLSFGPTQRDPKEYETLESASYPNSALGYAWGTVKNPPGKGDAPGTKPGVDMIRTFQSNNDETYWQPPGNSSPMSAWFRKDFLSPDIRVLGSTPKGHTIYASDAAKKSYMSIVDRYGQSLRFVDPIKDTYEKNNLASRRLHEAGDKSHSPLDVRLVAPSNSSDIILSDALFQSLWFRASDKFQDGEAVAGGQGAAAGSNWTNVPDSWLSLNAYAGSFKLDRSPKFEGKWPVTRNGEAEDGNYPGEEFNWGQGELVTSSAAYGLKRSTKDNVNPWDANVKYLHPDGLPTEKDSNDNDIYSWKPHWGPVTVLNKSYSIRVRAPDRLRPVLKNSSIYTSGVDVPYNYGDAEIENLVPYPQSGNLYARPTGDYDESGPARSVDSGVARHQWDFGIHLFGQDRYLPSEQENASNIAGWPSHSRYDENSGLHSPVRFRSGDIVLHSPTRMGILVNGVQDSMNDTVRANRDEGAYLLVRQQGGTASISPPAGSNSYSTGYLGDRPELRLTAGRYNRFGSGVDLSIKAKQDSSADKNSHNRSIYRLELATQPDCPNADQQLGKSWGSNYAGDAGVLHYANGRDIKEYENSSEGDFYCVIAENIHKVGDHQSANNSGLTHYSYHNATYGTVGATWPVSRGGILGSLWTEVWDNKIGNITHGSGSKPPEADSYCGGTFNFRTNIPDQIIDASLNIDYNDYNLDCKSIAPNNLRTRWRFNAEDYTDVLKPWPNYMSEWSTEVNSVYMRLCDYDSEDSNFYKDTIRMQSGEGNKAVVFDLSSRSDEAESADRISTAASGKFDRIQFQVTKDNNTGEARTSENLIFRQYDTTAAAAGKSDGQSFENRVICGKTDGTELQRRFYRDVEGNLVSNLLIDSGGSIESSGGMQLQLRKQGNVVGTSSTKGDMDYTFSLGDSTPDRAVTYYSKDGSTGDLTYYNELGEGDNSNVKTVYTRNGGSNATTLTHGLNADDVMIKMESPAGGSTDKITFKVGSMSITVEKSGSVININAGTGGTVNITGSTAINLNSTSAINLNSTAAINLTSTTAINLSSAAINLN